jgi:hypothetical protein
LKTITRALLALLLILGLVATTACSDDDGGGDLLPPTTLTAGFVVTVVPPVDTADDDQLDCRIKFTATNNRGGTPPYFHAWDFGALLVRAVQRVGGDGSAQNEFIGTQAAIGNGTYAIKLEVADSGAGAARQVASVTGFVFFRCEPGDPPSTFTF